MGLAAYVQTPYWRLSGKASSLDFEDRPRVGLDKLLSRMS